MQMLESSPGGSIWLNRFIPLTIQNIKDANAILLTTKTGLFSSRVLSSEEHSEVVNDLLNLGYDNLTYTKHASGTIIFDTLNDTLGCLTELHKEIKSLPKKLKITLGISYIDKDRAVIVREKFWDNEESRPKGYHFIDDLT